MQRNCRSRPCSYQRQIHLSCLMRVQYVRYCLPHPQFPNASPVPRRVSFERNIGQTTVFWIELGGSRISGQPPIILSPCHSFHLNPSPEEFNMANNSTATTKILGIVLVVIGLGLVIWGYQLSGSVGSRITQAVTGSDTDKVMAFYIAGAVSFVVGIYLSKNK